VDESSVESLLRRWRSLRGNRNLWDTHWDDLARVMVPRRLGFVTQVEEGDRRTDDIYDGTAIQAARGLANALGTFLRPEGEQWFFIKAVGAIDGEGEEWLNAVEGLMMEALDNPKARFRQATGEADLDVVVFGTAVVFEGENQNNLIFQTLHLKDALPLFDEQGNAEGMFRSHRFTVRQARDKFKILSEDTRSLIEQDRLDEKRDFLHCVIPRKEGRVGAHLAKRFPWADVWIETDAKLMVSQGGWQEFPFVVPRWDTSSGETYGRSPGMVALPDANSSQAIGETLLVAGQRAADPPLAVPNDSAFDAPNTMPGGLAYYDVDTARAVGGMPFFEIGNGGNIPLTREMQDDVRNQIWNAFFRSVLRLPVEGPQMTATEVNARRDEFIREIGPVFGRLETDYTAPLVERTFNIMLRGGAFPPIPEVLQGQSIRFEYASPIKKVRQQIEATAAAEWARGIMEVSQFRPEILDKVNVDKLADFQAKAANLPMDIVNTDEEVQALRAQRQQQQEAMAQMQAMQQMATTAKDAGSAAKDIVPMMENA
jgi:hypothetical protein